MWEEIENLILDFLEAFGFISWQQRFEINEKRLQKRIEERQSLEYALHEQQRLAEYQKHLKQHTKRFVCSICGRGSSKPGRKVIGESTRRDEDYRLVEVAILGDDWDEPGDMIHCLICGRWVHDSDHGQCSYKRVCRRCARRPDIHDLIEQAKERERKSRFR